MGEEIHDAMNLDLNLGPTPETGSGSVSNEGLDWDDLADNPFNRIREAVRRRRWRLQQVHFPAATQNLSVELDQFMGNSGNVSTLQAGEGSVAAEERTSDVPKACENTIGFLEDDVSEKKDDDERGISNDGSFFDCNICLDLAREPVVTCCGHLFCWSCLYRWLHVHSDANECPVCKGEVTVKTLTPIHGRGKITLEPEEESGTKIPPRPTARLVDSWRQNIQRNALNLPVEMIQHLGSRFDLTRDLTPPREANVAHETTEIADSVLNRILTSRGLRGEQTTVVSLDDVDLRPSSTTGTDVMPSRVPSLFHQRQSQLRRVARFNSLTSAFSPAEWLVEAYFRSNPTGRNPEHPPPPVDDRDSFSSIAAVINSESQVDTAVEIDSVVSSLSASSSRRRNDTPRVSDVDSGDSRAYRRRRLN